MIQTRPYEFMVRFTPQREWIEHHGVLFWLAFFFIELGAGAFLVSSIFGSLAGMLVGWLILAVLGGGFHLLYLGHPLRFWRIILSSGWKTSWISRGLYFVLLFLVSGFIYMLLASNGASNTALLVTADVFAFLAIIYAGFVMNYVNGIPLWNTALLPVLFAVSGIWGGIGVSILTMFAFGSAGLDPRLEEWGRIFLISYVFILAVYLISIRYVGSVGVASVREIVTGKTSIIFWAVVVVLGVLFPLAVSLLAGGGRSGTTAVILSIAILFELIGDLSLRYCILRCAYYNPLIPSIDYGEDSRSD